MFNCIRWLQAIVNFNSHLMKMNVRKLFIIPIIILMGCSDGKIQKRNDTDNYPSSGRDVYLVNTSKSKKITFTIKKVKSKINESPYITVYQETLFPGDETYLGKEKESEYYNDSLYYNSVDYSIEGELIIPVTAE